MFAVCCSATSVISFCNSNHSLGGFEEYRKVFDHTDMAYRRARNAERERTLHESLSDVKEAYEASLLDRTQKTRQSKCDVINLADLKILMRSLGQPINVERLKEALNVSMDKDVRHRIDVDFLRFIKQLEHLIEDPESDVDIRNAFATLEELLRSNEGCIYLEDMQSVAHKFSDYISPEEVEEMFDDLNFSKTSCLNVDDFLYTLKTVNKTLFLKR